MFAIAEPNLLLTGANVIEIDLIVPRYVAVRTAKTISMMKFYRKLRLRRRRLCLNLKAS